MAGKQPVTAGNSAPTPGQPTTTDIAPSAAQPDATPIKTPQPATAPEASDVAPQTVTSPSTKPPATQPVTTTPQTPATNAGATTTPTVTADVAPVLNPTYSQPNNQTGKDSAGVLVPNRRKTPVVAGGTGTGSTKEPATVTSKLSATTTTDTTTRVTSPVDTADYLLRGLSNFVIELAKCTSAPTFNPRFDIESIFSDSAISFERSTTAPYDSANRAVFVMKVDTLAGSREGAIFVRIKMEVYTKIRVVKNGVVTFHDSPIKIPVWQRESFSWLSWNNAQIDLRSALQGNAKQFARIYNYVNKITLPPESILNNN